MLKQNLLNMDRCGILFSGGYDSEVLLRSAVSVLGSSNVVPLTADTGLLADYYRRSILSVAEELSVKPLFIPLDPLSSREFTQNTDKRCYICKKKLYTRLKREAVACGCDTVMDGTNTDDLDEHRPGLTAAAETGIVHPFLEACMGKGDIAQLGAFLGARFSPSDSCLATRIPSGIPITLKLLTLVESMEAPLRPYVKGRFRVTVGTGRLLVNYTAADENLVKDSLRQLRRIAKISGHQIELHLLEQ